MASRRFLTRTDVARLLDVSPATVARWTRQGKLPFVLTLGGQRRYARHAILELVCRLHAPRQVGPLGAAEEPGAARPRGTSRPLPRRGGGRR